MSYWSKVTGFNVPPAFGTPVGVIPFEFCRDLWHQKTRVPGLFIMWHYLYNSTFSRFDTIPECDRHTDTHTDTRRRHIPRCIASRGKNECWPVKQFCLVSKRLAFICREHSILLYPKATSRPNDWNKRKSRPAQAVRTPAKYFKAECNQINDVSDCLTTISKQRLSCKVTTFAQTEFYLPFLTIVANQDS